MGRYWGIDEGDPFWIVQYAQMARHFREMAALNRRVFNDRPGALDLADYQDEQAETAEAKVAVFWKGEHLTGTSYFVARHGFAWAVMQRAGMGSVPRANATTEQEAKRLAVDLYVADCG